MERSKHYATILEGIEEQVRDNYRPVSLTSVLCKLPETLIRDHNVEFLVKHQLINTSQHVFPNSKVMSNQSLIFS